MPRVRPLVVTLTTAAALCFTPVASAAAVVSPSDAAPQRADWCGGLAVTAPAKGLSVPPGVTVSVTVTGKPGDPYEKVLGRVDLYRVLGGAPQRVGPVWQGKRPLGVTAEMRARIPDKLEAGQHLFRVWLTNFVDGKPGPACAPFGARFTVVAPGQLPG
ncbi:hypothetical protein [Sciscionella sediminilitoris]|uniref:hypothetical protein n=1 Tax=Sciscionella sediminilitoris TaxID=1445613 RepID=UPI0004DF4514|nr:hypothetical protein [Sciscionella sp. SE31]